MYTYDVLGNAASQFDRPRHESVQRSRHAPPPPHSKVGAARARPGDQNNMDVSSCMQSLARTGRDSRVLVLSIRKDESMTLVVLPCSNPSGVMLLRDRGRSVAFWALDLASAPCACASPLSARLTLHAHIAHATAALALTRHLSLSRPQDHGLLRQMARASTFRAGGDCGQGHDMAAGVIRVGALRAATSQEVRRHNRVCDV